MMGGLRPRHERGGSGSGPVGTSRTASSSSPPRTTTPARSGTAPSSTASRAPPLPARLTCRPTCRITARWRVDTQGDARTRPARALTCPAAAAAACGLRRVLGGHENKVMSCDISRGEHNHKHTHQHQHQQHRRPALACESRGDDFARLELRPAPPHTLCPRDLRLAPKREKAVDGQPGQPG